MDEPSFDPRSVPPHKLREAMRRSAVVAEYVKIRHPTRSRAHEYAARLGIGIRLFYMLVKTYRERGTIIPAAREASPRGKAIDPRVHEIILSAIDELSPDASAPAILELVNERCEQRNLPQPSIMAVRTRLFRKRSEGRGTDAFPTLVIDRSAVELNVASDVGPVAAWLTLVLHASTASVVGHHVSAGVAGPREAALALLAGLKAPPLADAKPAANAPIAYFPDRSPLWAAFGDVLASNGLNPIGPAVDSPARGVAIHRIIGDRLGRLVFRPRLKAGLPAVRGGEPVELDTARTMVADDLGDRALYRPEEQMSLSTLLGAHERFEADLKAFALQFS